MKRSTFILVVLALSLGTMGGAKGDSIAYNLVDYAPLQTGSGGTDDNSISGQIITDGATGTFSGDFTSHIAGASLTLTTPSGTYVVPSAQAVFYPFLSTNVEATPAALSMLG